MSNEWLSKFHWCDKAEQKGATPAEQYERLTAWARRARGINPNAFDQLTEWLLDDAAWTADQLKQNEHILLEGVLEPFRAQNAYLRERLTALEPSGVVNPAIMKELDHFDEELSGLSHVKEWKDALAKVAKDFSVLRDRDVRALLAGNKTGPEGTDSVDYFGYINDLKNCDAAVQWALFMPDLVDRQQKGFKVERFEYKKLPAMRFIGFEGEEYSDVAKRVEKMQILRAMTEYATALPFDTLLMHHYGLGVDIGPWHGVWGRFMQAGAPVPEGYLSYDFTPESDGKQGLPYLSQFAYATFSGDPDALHRCEGYDGDAMYDVTRNIILGQGVPIPYPYKYWTAEVFPDGCDKPGSAYLFSVER